MGEILLIPTGGLANRMRAIASAFSLAQDCRKELTVLWHKDKGLNANFEDIFITDQLPFKLTDVSSLAYNFFYDIPRKKNLWSPILFHKLERRFWLYHEGEIVRKMNEDDFRNLASSYKDIAIMSCYEFYTYNHDVIKKLFQPSITVIKRKESICKGRIPEVALQIRRTDNVESISKSPVFLFEQIAEEEIRKNPEINIFFATDDEKLKVEFQKRYNKNLIFNPMPAERNSKDGIIDAFAEMLIMADCKIIYGSYFSSFSELASQYYGSPLKVVKRNLFH